MRVAQEEPSGTRCLLRQRLAETGQTWLGALSAISLETAQACFFPVSPGQQRDGVVQRVHDERREDVKWNVTIIGTGFYICKPCSKVFWLLTDGLCYPIM